MDFLLNELSLHSQYHSERDFLKSLKMIMACDEAIKKAGYHLYCSRELISREIINSIDFRQAIKNTGDRNFIQFIVNWLAKNGPFWNEKRQHSEDDYFEYQTEVVTNYALAEAAWRIANQHECHTISFEPSDFNCTPLKVIWHQSEGVEKAISVQNLWQLVTLTKFLKESVKPPKNWNDLINQCIKRYTNLTFADNLLDNLEPEPFSETIADRIQILLSYVNELNGCFDENGQLNKRGTEIIKNYFQGTKALFTDESETNKQHFKEALTFGKPRTDEKIFCPFHGKIKAGRQYRIHFNWPKEKPTEPLYIVYIGPKITKH